MPKFQITSPEGAVYEVTAPDGATEQDALAYVQKNSDSLPALQQDNQAVTKGNVKEEAKNDPNNPMSRRYPWQWNAEDRDVFRLGALRGLTAAGSGLLGAGDEIAAGARGVYRGAEALLNGRNAGLAFQDEYDTSLANIRETQRLAREASPIGSVLAEMGSGTVATAPLAMLGVAAKGAPLAQKVFEAGKVAAPLGAASGFMAGDGGLDNRLDEAWKDGLLYTGFATGIPVVGTALTGVAKAAGSAIPQAARMVRDVAERMMSPEKAALRTVGKAIQNDAEEIPYQQLLAKMYETGMSPAEVGGRNLGMVADTLANQPGSTAGRIAAMQADRVDGQRALLPQVIRDTLGVTGQGTNAIERMEANRAANAPLFQEALDQPVVNMTDKLKALLQDEDVRKGLQQGYVSERRFGWRDGIPQANPKALGLDLNDVGDVIFTDAPTFRALHTAKTGLDELARVGQDALTGQKTPEGAGYAFVAQALRDEMKAINPKYAEALAQSADRFQLDDAMRFGRNLWTNTNKEEAVTLASRMSPAEKQTALEGAVRGLVEQMERKGDTWNMANTNLNKAYFRDMMQPLVDDPKQLATLVDKLNDFSKAFTRNQQWLNGSQTAMRQSAQRDIARNLQSAWESLQHHVMGGDRYNQALGDILLSRAPENAQQVLDTALRLAGNQKKLPPLGNSDAIAKAVTSPEYQNMLLPFYANEPMRVTVRPSDKKR